MSTASASTPEVISLPKGGGALHGIGEKFSPDLHTGTGNFTVPIALPPGRNGFQPQLNLVYSTGNGSGPFGLGWAVSTPHVSRRTSKGIPNFDLRDVFVLSGAEDLASVPSDRPGTEQYRPRTEGLFARIYRHAESGDDYWEVQSKDGLVSLYGTPRASGADESWRDPAVVADPERSDHVFSWKLSRTTDTFGNRIEYLYERDPVRVDGPHRWDQVYLAEIRYLDYGDPEQPEFLVTVRFTYEERPDPFSEYRAGFEIRTVRRCTRVDVTTHPGTDTPVRTYHLVYLDQGDPSAEELPLNGVSLLSEIRVEGHDGGDSEWLPPLEFGYTRFAPEKRDLVPIDGPDMPLGSLARPDYTLVDLIGNGLPDILEMNGAVRFWRNRGKGTIDLPREMRDAPAGVALADPGVQIVDANGDGRADLLVTTTDLTGYYPMRFGGLWDRRSFQRYRHAPSFDLEDPEVRLVDLDGDGVTDAIRSGSRLECFFNDPREGWNGTRWVERRSLEEFPNVTFSDPRVKWADMTGDGLQDIVLVYDGNVDYWPALAYGRWATRVSMHDSPRFPYGYDERRILVGDVDGDGAADLVYVDDAKVTLWINLSGNGWSEPIEIDGTPPLSDMDDVRLVDMLGTGVAGVLWSADSDVYGRARMFFLDFTGGITPGLCNFMDNHMGAITRVEYAPSTRFYTADEQRPETRWKTPLPFPVQVVARVEVIDQISRGKLATEYRYHHGYWDGAEREFRGFGRVDQRDTEVFERYHEAGLHPDEPFAEVPIQFFSPPTETRTWFHQGPVGDEFGEWEEQDFGGEFWPEDPPALASPSPTSALLMSLPRRARRDALRALRGSILRTEFYALDGGEREGRPYTVTEHSYGLREVDQLKDAAPDRLRVFLPHLVAERTTQWERGDEPMTRYAFVGERDEYGQPLWQASIAVPRTSGEQYLATYTTTTYAQRDDQNHYIVDRVAQTTSYGAEVPDDGTLSVSNLVARVDAGLVDWPVISKTVNYYDGEAFVGLPASQVGEHGALVRTERLVLTESTLHKAYRTGGEILDPPEEPPYLSRGGPPSWPSEYPEGFRSLPSFAGYVVRPVPEADGIDGFFSPSERRRYDFQEQNGQARGLVKAKLDPLGHPHSIESYDFDLLPAKITDAVGLSTSAEYDPRVLQPSKITDPNGNDTVFVYTPLGLLASAGVRGNAEGEGDPPDAPSLRFEHAFPDYAVIGEPISVHTIRRVRHKSENDVLPPELDETIEAHEYSNGFGRLLQTRTQAEDVFFGDPTFGGAVLLDDQAVVPGDAVGQQVAADSGPRVVVSGWQVYDNKGRVVEKFEPFFSVGWAYSPPTEEELGQKATLHYDPRGRLVRTINPDLSEQRIVQGVPLDLAHPDNFVPTPWVAYVYDPNDNAGRTHPTQSLAYQDHWNTPASVVIDALGRTVETVVRNGSDPTSDWLRTRSKYDIRGNVLTVTDELDRLAFSYVHDLDNRPLRVANLDAGTRRAVHDAAGNVVEQRDARGAVTLYAYDSLNRPTRLWARDEADGAVSLRERLEYGDGGTSEQLGEKREANREANRLGRLHRHYDEAGLLTFETYDFKGNSLEKTRRVVADVHILAGFDAPPAEWKIQAFRLDWEPWPLSIEAHADALLDGGSYRTSMTYDALNRVRSLFYPEDVEGARRELRRRYNRAGALERMDFDGTTFVERIAYDAKGQRTLVAYGNGVLTRYAYDRQTFRLTRMRTERCEPQSNNVLHPIGPSQPLQEFGYAYDLVGNILQISDRTPGCGVASAAPPEGSDALDKVFTYYPLYWLKTATGRQCSHLPAPWPWTDAERCGFDSGNHGTPNQQNAPHLTAIYEERYEYDAAGNLLRLKHATSSGAWTRHFGTGGLIPQDWDDQWRNHLNSGAPWLDPPSNRLTHVGDSSPSTPQTHFFDATGNLIRETISRHFEWDHVGRMKAFRTQTGAAEPSTYAQYLYNTSGQRVMKLVRKQGGVVDTTVYIDGLFEHQRRFEPAGTRANNTLHVQDALSRIATVRVGSPLNKDATPATKFNLEDHLGSSTLVLGILGDWINREEYTPFGETSFGGFSRKRYRFSGKERDEESALSYHGARYFAHWLGRWVSCDERLADGLNRYLYAWNNPICVYDPTGRNGEGGRQENGNLGAHGSGSGGEPVATPEEAEVCLDPHAAAEQDAHASLPPAELCDPARPPPEQPPPDADTVDRGHLADFATTSLSYSEPVSATRAAAIRKRTGLEPTVRASITTEDLDDLQFALDTAGMVEALGTPADVTNAMISVARGNWTEAGASAVSAVPVLGVLTGGGKIALKIERRVERVSELVGRQLSEKEVQYVADFVTRYEAEKTGLAAEEFVDFSSHTIKEVDIGLPRGSRGADERAANALARLKDTPEGYTWHHHEDLGRMQLVETWVHDLLKHSGAVTSAKKVGLPHGY